MISSLWGYSMARCGKPQQCQERTSNIINDSPGGATQVAGLDIKEQKEWDIAIEREGWQKWLASRVGISGHE